MTAPTRPIPLTDPDLDDLVDRMARREVTAHFLVPADQPPGVIRPPAPALAVRVRACSACGADAATFAASGTPLPFAHWLAEPDDGAPSALPTLTVLGCEWFAPRAVLAVAVALDRYDGAATAAFRSRAVALTDLGVGPDAAPTATALALLEAAERWVDAVAAGVAPAAFAEALAAPDPAPRGAVVPAASRAVSTGLDWTAHRDLLTPGFLGPHPRGPRLTRMNDAYLTARRVAAELALAGDATCPA
ncbi:hypothetical protein [Phytohabitans rumicis]|uniref:Uncharacterized protein n=1 Tax=Phytohabitans rumicis TaxID=1076125 RepID=A0A6V8KWR9_9ACTN|nr:hypothetical protein [Phytohabitans rumicis]GFJ86739.1 hypothetical protein Prum_003810 [Phytohabitans rumicis]